MPSPTSPGITVSPFVFCVCWWVLLLFHLFNSLYLGIFGLIHVAISLPLIYSFAWMLRIPQSLLMISGWTYLVIAAFDFGIACLHIKRSIVCGHLVFLDDRPDRSGGPQLSKQSLRAKKQSVIMYEQGLDRVRCAVKASRSMVNRVWGPLRRIIQRYFGLHGLFGLHGRLYDFGFYTRHIIELIFQAYQADQLSRTVPRVSLNRLVVFFIMANALYAPVIDVLLRDRPSRRRVMIVVVDIILEFGLSVGVTLSVILPYVLLFNWSAGRFPDPYGYDDVWLANLLSELRQVLISSKMDYASSMFPHIMMLMGTDILESIIRRGTPKRVTPSTDCIVVPQSNSRRRTSLMDFFSRSSSITPPRVSKRLHRVLHVLELLAIGFAATQVYLHYHTHFVATSHPVQGCGLHMYPWFAVNFSCAVIQINCYRIKSTGTEQDMIKELGGLERGVLTKLIFSHCPALEVPSIVTEFSHLQVLETFNCSISKWKASIRHRQQPILMQVHLVDTNMTVFPDGLMQPEPPQDLSLYLYHTNLSSLPDNVGEAWKTKKPWRYIRIECSELTSIPESISQAPIEFFSIVGNHIKRFPENIFATQTFTVLQLSQNPLIEIPASIGDTRALGIFMADDTNVSGLPPWFQDWYTTQKVVSLRGSPFCASDTDGISPLCRLVPPGAVFAFRYDLVVPFRPL